MIVYGASSLRVLAELDPKLRDLLNEYAAEAPPELDLTLVDGYRSPAEQEQAFNAGNSTKHAGESKHNLPPGKVRAVDFKPYPFIKWDDPVGFAQRVGALRLTAARLHIKIRCGIDWAKPFDPGHIELV